MRVTQQTNLIFFCLKDIAEIQIGYHSRGPATRLFKSEYHLLRGEDIRNNEIRDIKGFVDFDIKKNSDRYLLKKNDILFQSKGTNNFSYYVKKEVSKTVVSSTFYIFRVKDKRILDPFLAWWINTDDVQNKLKGKASGSYIPFISKKTLEDLLVPLIPMEVQEIIIKIDETWKKERNLLKNYTELKSKLMNRYYNEIINKYGEKNG